MSNSMPHWLWRLLHSYKNTYRTHNEFPYNDLLPLNVAGYNLAPAEIPPLLSLLADEDNSIIQALKSHCKPAELDGFVGRLLNIWQTRNFLDLSPTLFSSLMQLASPACVPHCIRFFSAYTARWQNNQAMLMQLMIPFLRQFGKRRHAGAMFELFTLWLDRQHWVRRQAADDPLTIRQASEKLNLDYAQLAEYSLPALEITGTQLDYGTRQFTIAADSALRLRLRDELGKTYTELPTIETGDNVQLAREASKTWANWHYLLPDVQHLSGFILEKAMLDERRWTQDDFQRLLKHPLWRHFIQAVIWGVYTPQGDYQTSLRVCEDGTFADSQDRQYTFPADHLLLSVIHPIYLSPAERDAWQSILYDYEILPPFEQMTRLIYQFQRPPEPRNWLPALDLPPTLVLREVQENQEDYTQLSFLGWSWEINAHFQRHLQRTFASGVRVRVDFVRRGKVGGQHFEVGGLQCFTQETLLLEPQLISPIIISEITRLLLRWCTPT